MEQFVMCKKYFVPIDPHTLLKSFFLLLSDLYHHKKLKLK